ncbi:MAG: ABC transporter substrate-binding protein [Nitrospirota bacterium]|nr:ABC transporter substrate-binding protein [Nitrospirota bacterium]
MPFEETADTVSKFSGQSFNFLLRGGLVLILLLSLAACGSRQERLPDHLYLRLGTNPTTLDPAFIIDVSGASITAKLFNGLIRFNDDMSVAPDVASSWKVSRDGRTYQFTLRSDVFFSSGRKVTAHDFKYSFERVLHPETKSPRSWVLDRIDGAREYQQGTASEVTGIRAVDDSHLEITLRERFAPFLSLLAMPAGYVVPKEEIERWREDFGSHPVGTGPYQLTEWQQGRGVLLSANPAYFDRKPSLKGVYYRIIPDEMTAVVEFGQGNLDILAVPASEYGRFRRDPEWNRLLVSGPGLNVYYLGMNCGKPPFDDPRIRRAMNYAIDREKILRTIMEGRGTLAAGPIPPFLLKTDNTGYRYDPAMSRRLLAEAGHPGGIDATLYLNLDQDTLDMVEVIQGYLKEVGIRITLRQLEWSAFKAAVVNGEADAFWLSWWADYPDPENFLFPVFHSANAGAGGNRARFSDPETDLLIEAAAKTGSEEERKLLYQSIQHRVVSLAPWVFMWHKAEVLIHQPWVRGVKLFPLASADKGVEVSLDTSGSLMAAAGRRGQ